MHVHWLTKLEDILKPKANLEKKAYSGLYLIKEAYQMNKILLKLGVGLATWDHRGIVQKNPC